MTQVIAVKPGAQKDRSATTSQQPRAPVWKTVIKVTLIVLAVAAAVYLGAKFVIPAVVHLIQGVGSAAASAAGAATAAAGVVTAAGDAVKHTAEGVTKGIKLLDTLGNKPLVATYFDTVETAIQKTNDMFTVTTSSGTVRNPGAILQFIKNPFNGILNLIKGVFTK